MNKAKKVILAIATGCIAVGLVMSGTAFALTGFDFSALSTVERKVQEHYVAPSANIEAIVFRGLSDDVRVERAAVQTIEVDYWGNDVDSYSIEEQDGTLQIAVWTRPVAGIYFNLQETPVVIRIPQAYKGTIELATASGDIACYDEGDLAALQVNSISGALVLGAANVKGSVSLGSTSGSIQVKNLTASDVSLATVSGAIGFEALTAADITLRSTSGRIQGNIEGSARDYSIRASSTSGEIRVPLGSTGGSKSLEVNTVSGNVGIDFTG
ncbi:MAG: DUF4097 domain-containing protein [Coriobacteriales bacterium]|jgi:DUF4097 and DUF4098 domain-containing protein YvlB|nr:DUF4097 domain-containing protein [Coriobacteriales bacterium]